ncbi:MAG: hypothetical protein Q8S73_03395, partial [Deltaproteobacteria bacterium]|nr:hypothetical protein [Deltaproteobacteria bacterium]
HCGGCGRACDPSERCVAGACECAPGAVCGEQCAGVPVIDAARVGTRTGNVLRILGDNTAAWSAQNPGGVLASRSPIVNAASSCPRSTGQLVYRYTTTMGAALRVTTSNPGTRVAFDTVLYATGSCGAAINNACNDDDPDLAASRGLTSRLLIDSLPAGFTLYIVVGGYSPLTSGTFDRGAFELTISEENTLAVGASCRTDGATGRCASGLTCALPSPGVEAGTCRAAGAGVGAPCRAASPQCDAGLSCGTSGVAANVCIRDVGLGAACDDYSRCAGANFCSPLNFGTTRGTCVAPGTVFGAPCRGTAPQCDGALVCAVFTGTDTTACRVPASANGPCSAERSVCPTGYHCATASDGFIGLCRLDGTAASLPCRESAPRCDGGLECVVARSGDTACRAVVGAGSSCSENSVCAVNTTCYRPDTSDPFYGICVAVGAPGGDCRATGTRCDGGATCTTETGAGRCLFRVGEGEACRAPTHYCAAGLNCVLSPGDTVNGVCRATGSAAGARCGAGGSCLAGLTCSSAASGICSAATSGDCDPYAGTTVCPAGQACLASSVLRGRCGPMGAESEPNDTIALAASRPVSAPTALAGSLPFNDVDCMAVQVPAGGSVVAFASDGNGRCPLAAGRLAMELYDSDGATLRLIAEVNGPGNCANIDGGRRAVFPDAGALSAGVYTVCVHAVPTTAVPTPSLASYVLTVAATP